MVNEYVLLMCLPLRYVTLMVDTRQFCTERNFLTENNPFNLLKYTIQFINSTDLNYIMLTQYLTLSFIDRIVFIEVIQNQNHIKNNILCMRGSNHFCGYVGQRLKHHVQWLSRKVTGQFVQGQFAQKNEIDKTSPNLTIST